MIDALNKLYEVVWQTECLPEGWKNSLLLQLDKKKPDKKDLANKRFIHMKEDIAKLFGHIVTSAEKPKIMENLPNNQIGTVPGHQAQENIFIIKSFIGSLEMSNQAAAVQFFDISKFFDREFLGDGMNELYKCSITGKLYRLIFLLNKDT